MFLTQMDIQLRMPYGPNPSGWYYWTNTYYFYWDGDPGSSSPPYKISIAFEHTLGTMVQKDRVLYTTPPHSGIVYANFGLPHDHCIAGHVVNPIIENVARVSLFAGTKYVGYKLLRAAVGEGEVTDGMIDPSIVAYIQGQYADQLPLAGCTTADGTPITSAVVSPKIHHWQLRHGTKRRQRVVIAP